MKGRGMASNSRPRMTWLLVLVVATLTVLPVVVFATDLPHRRTVQARREQALERAGVAVRRESEAVRQERRRAGRANAHPTASSFAMSMAIQLVILALFAAVGRRLFALRL